jgi:membrane protease YdiL (CAAX protease family)
MGLAERERSERSMGRNVYLVAAAIISLIFAVAHTWWG